MQYLPSLSRCLLPSGFKAVIPYDFLISSMPGTCSAPVISFCFTVQYNAEDTGEIHYYVANTTTLPVIRRAVILIVSLHIQETYVKLLWLLSFNPLNAELNPICHLLVLLGDLTFMCPCIVSIFQHISNKM